MVAFVVLAIATCASFWRGYGMRVTHIEPTSTQNTKTESSLYLGRGGIFVRQERNESTGDFSWFKPKSQDVEFFATSPRYPDNDWLGIGRKFFSYVGPLGTRREVGVTAPLWIVPVALLAPIAIWLRRRRRRAMRGRCNVCGYDVRASPDHCPECGTPVVATIAKDESRLSLRTG